MRRSLRGWWREGEAWYGAVALANLVLGTSSVLTPLMLSRVLGHSVGKLGLFVSLVSLVGVIGSLLWGRLSDAAARRKPFVVVSYGVVGLCFLAVAFVPSFEHFLWINMLLNFFWVANASVTVLIVIENRDEAAWEAKIGQLNQVGAIGWVLGLALGSAALAAGTFLASEEVAIRSLFIIIAMGGLMASTMAFRRIPRTAPKFTRRQFRGAILALGNHLIERMRFAPFHLYHRLQPRRILATLRDPQGFRPGTKRFLSATFVTFVGVGLFGIPLPLLLSERFGLPSYLVFAFFALQHLGVVAAYPLAARRIRRRGNRRVQIGTILVRLVLFSTTALFLAFFKGSPPTVALVIGFAIYGLTWSYLQLSGIALVSRLARAENRGLALGLYNGLAGIGFVIAGFTSGLLAGWGGYQSAFGASAGLLLIALLIVLTVPRPIDLPQETRNGRDPVTNLPRELEPAGTS
ncbi:MAG: MFS transporter [Candidatus Bipolaricaulia bacterium]